MMKIKQALPVFMAVLCTGFFSCIKDNEGILGVDVPVDSGVVSADTPYIIKRVDRFSPAYDAGLEPGDEIIQINQTEIRNGMVFSDIYNTLLTGKPGTRIVFYVRRGGRILVYDVVMTGKRR